MEPEQNTELELFMKELEKPKQRTLREQLIRRLVHLECEIMTWGESHSQSNPGAVMELRSMKKEVEEIEDLLREKEEPTEKIREFLERSLRRAEKCPY
jgi:hypothetical protein